MPGFFEGVLLAGGARVALNAKDITVVESLYNEEGSIVIGSAVTCGGVTYNVTEVPIIVLDIIRELTLDDDAYAVLTGDGIPEEVKTILRDAKLTTKAKRVAMYRYHELNNPAGPEVVEPAFDGPTELEALHTALRVRMARTLKRSKTGQDVSDN